MVVFLQLIFSEGGFNFTIPWNILGNVLPQFFGLKSNAIHKNPGGTCVQKKVVNFTIKILSKT